METTLRISLKQNCVGSGRTYRGGIVLARDTTIELFD